MIEGMRTSEVYKTPNIRNNHSNYLSKTFWYPEDYLSCCIEIVVWWFNGLGWMYRVQLESHWDVYCKGHKPCPKGRRACELDLKGESRRYPSGKDLALASQDADSDAAVLITARGLKMPVLAPYRKQVRSKTYGIIGVPDYAQYLKEGTALNAHLNRIDLKPFKENL